METLTGISKILCRPQVVGSCYQSFPDNLRSLGLRLEIFALPMAWLLEGQSDFGEDHRCSCGRPSGAGLRLVIGPSTVGICVYISIHIIYIIYTYMYVYIFMYVCMFAPVFTIHVHTSVHKHMHSHTCMHMYLHECSYTYIQPS